MIAVYLTGLGTILLLLIPFIPGLRDIPRLIPIHRLIWRSWYRPAPGPVPGTGPGSGSGKGSGSSDELAVGQPANGAKKA
jgi:hypothetical protein